MTVESIMTKEVISVGMDHPFEKLNKILQEAKFHHILVLDEKKLVGIISDRDILREFSPFIGTLSETEKDRKILQKKAHQIMSRNLITVNPHTPIKTATSLLLDNGISCLPVVSLDNKLLGIITWRDLLKKYIKNK